MKEQVLMSEDEIGEVVTYLIPVVMVKLKSGEEEFQVLIDLIRGDVIKDIINSIIISQRDAVPLKDYQNFEKISYKELTYSKKLNKKKLVDEVILNIKEQILEKKECFIVYYKLIKKYSFGKTDDKESFDEKLK
jgi:hypothetical protein